MSHAPSRKFRRATANQARPQGGREGRRGAAGPSLRRARALKAEGRLLEALGAYEEALARRPDDTAILFELGNIARNLKMPEAAERFYRRVLAHQPDSVEAANNLASLWRSLGRAGDAIDLLQQAIAADPAIPELWVTLGSVMADQEDFANAATFFDEALRLRPDHVEAHANLGEARYAAGDAAGAMTSIETALRLAPKRADLHYNRGVNLLAAGQPAQGFAELEWRLEPDFHRYVARDLDMPRWQGEDLADRTILICAEQGVGDELHMADCYPDVIARAGHCIVECDRRLVDLFARNFPAATFRAWDGRSAGARAERHYGWLDTVPKPDCYIEAASLRLHFRGGLDRFPTRRALLVADPTRREFWRERVAATGPGLKVGISWTSILTDHFRNLGYTALSEWEPILGQTGLRFFSLQYGDVEAELAQAERAFETTIHRWPELDLKDDFESVAALIANLDLVIAPTNTARQIAACLDVPVWVMSRLPSHFNLGGSTNVFYPSSRDYVRLPNRDWSNVVSRIADDLAEWIRGRKEAA